MTDGWLRLGMSGELVMPGGATAQVLTEANAYLAGIPVVVPLVRAPDMGFTVINAESLLYNGTADTEGQASLDIVLPAVMTATVTGTVSGMEPQEYASMTLICGEQSAYGPAVDGVFELVVRAYAAPSCNLSLSGTAQETALNIARPVALGALVDGSASGTAQLSLPESLAVSVVDGRGAPVDASVYVSSSADILMPDGVVAHVNGYRSALVQGGAPMTLLAPRSEDTYASVYPLYQGTSFYGPVDTRGADEMTYVAEGLGHWVTTGPTASNDGDGVPDLVEAGAPNGGDGNDDGIADSEQPDVTSVPSWSGNYVTLEAPAGVSFGPVTAVDPSDYGTPPAGVTLPDGLVSFELDGVTPGGSAIVRIYSASLAGVTGYAKWHDDAWLVMPAGNVAVNAPLGYVDVTLVDGGVGDDDGDDNGTIVDPGGVAILSDTTPPAITCGAAPSDWSASDRSISCTASDAGSGLAQPADATFALTTAVPAGTEVSTASTGSREVCDAASNCATAGPFTGLKVDKKAPTVTLTRPTQGQSIPQGSSVTAAFTCADGGSGGGSCVGTVPNGQALPTSSAGAGASRSLPPMRWATSGRRRLPTPSPRSTRHRSSGPTWASRASSRSARRPT